MIAEMLIVILGLVLGLFGYSYFTRANPSKILGLATSIVTSATVYGVSFWTGFVNVIRADIAGGWGLIGYMFVAIWFAAIPALWFTQGLLGWYHDRPFLKSMIQ